MRWINAIRAPSNSVPLPVLMVVGEKAFQMIDSQMLVAMKREMPVQNDDDDDNDVKDDQI